MCLRADGREWRINNSRNGPEGWPAADLDRIPRARKWRWVPYVSSEARGREDGIARGLIRRCIEYVEERGQTRLEVCFDRISDATMPHYERYRTWFEAERVYKVDDSAYLRRGLTPGEFSEDDVALPPGY